MASFTDKISVVIDVATEKAQTGLKNFRTSVAEAEGATGKLKAGVSSLGGMFSSAAANPAVMAGAVGAAGAAAFKAVGDFSSLGVEIGNFSEATGTAYEDASRWVEVAGDLDVPVDALEKSMNKLNKSIDPQLFKDLGIEIATTNTGATDVNGTFLNVIQKLHDIKDPAERAKTATKLLGKGWQDMAELIGKGSSELSKSLAGVDDAKVFDAEKVAKARRYRDATKDLGDAFEAIAITIGEDLAPALSRAVEDATPLIELVGTLGDKLADLQDFTDAQEGSFLGDVFQSAKNAINPIDMAKDAYGKFQELTGDPEGHLAEGALKATAAKEAIIDMGDASKEAAEKAYYLSQQEDEAAYQAAQMRDRVTEAKNRLKDLQDQIDGSKSLVDLRISLRDNAEKIAEIKKNFDEGKISAQAYYDQTASLTLDSMSKVQEYATSIGNIPTDAVTTLVANLDPSNPEAIFGELQEWFNGRKLNVTVTGMIADSALRNLMEGRVPGGATVGYMKNATGTSWSAGGATLVGEQGPEIVNMPRGAEVIPAGPTARLLGAGGGGTTVVNQVNNIRTNADYRQLQRALKLSKRRGATSPW